MRQLTKFEKLYIFVMQSPRTKNECAKHLDVTTKTVENIVKKYSDIIRYETKVHKYYLAGYITHRVPPLLLYLIAKEELEKMNLPLPDNIVPDIQEDPIPVSQLDGKWMMKIIEYTQKADGTLLQNIKSCIKCKYWRYEVCTNDRSVYTGEFRSHDDLCSAFTLEESK